MQSLSERPIQFIPTPALALPRVPQQRPILSRKHSQQRQLGPAQEPADIARGRVIYENHSCSNKQIVPRLPSLPMALQR